MSASPARRALLTATTALAPAVWGTTYLVTTEALPSGHPMHAALLRALPAGLVAVLLTRSLPRGSWWWRSLVLGGLNIGLFFPLLFVAAERLPGGVAATLGGVQPIVVALLVVPVLHERVSRWRLGWGVVGVVGVALVVLGPGAALDPVGVVAGVAGTVSMALGVTLSKRWGRPEGVGPLGYAGWLLTAGGLVLAPLTLLLEAPPGDADLAGIAGYLWLGLVGGLVAYTLWFHGIGALPVTATALLGLLSPLVAAALGALVLGERFGAIQGVGFGLALGALLAGQLQPGAGGTPRSPRGPDRSAQRPDPWSPLGGGTGGGHGILGSTTPSARSTDVQRGTVQPAARGAQFRAERGVRRAGQRQRRAVRAGQG